MVSKTKIPQWVANAGLVLLGLLFAGAMMAVFLIIFPQYRPGVTIFTVSHGDIFFHQAVWVKPPPNPDEILDIYTINWDADGFRIPARQASHYPILAVGDSFTEAPNVGRPWTDVLAEAAQTAVKNLAYRGYGPVEQAHILAEYGADSGAETVVVGFFEGNDLANAVTAEGQPVLLPSEVTSEQRQLVNTDVETVTERDERYPMQVEINGVSEEIAFFEAYAWVLNASEGSFARSRNLQITLQSYEAMREAMPDACLVVAYFPTKPHIYLPYLKPEYQPILMQKVERFSAQDGEPLRLVAMNDTTFEELLQRLPNLRNAFKAQVEAAGFVFFDLTPVLQDAAARGEMLYYTYDTHWNQAGHEVVGRAIADFLAQNPCA